MSERIAKLRAEFGAVDGPNKSLVLKKDGVVTDMVAYWDDHAGYHRVSDAGTAILGGSVSEPPKPAPAPQAQPKLGLPGRK